MTDLNGITTWGALFAAAVFATPGLLVLSAVLVWDCWKRGNRDD